MDPLSSAWGCLLPRGALKRISARFWAPIAAWLLRHKTKLQIPYQPARLVPFGTRRERSESYRVGL